MINTKKANTKLCKECINYFFKVELPSIGRSFFSINKSPDKTTRGFILLSEIRTGSTLLGSFMENQPDIDWGNEIFLLRCLMFPNLFLESMRKNSKSRVFGTKCFIHPVIEFNQQADWFECMAKKGWKVVWLQRRNKIRHALSIRRSMASNIWHKTKEMNSSIPDKWHPIPDQIFFTATRLRDREEQISRRLTGSDHHVIIYEDALEYSEFHQDTMDQLCDFLGQPSIAVKTELIKYSPGHIADNIDNYDDIVRVFVGTEFEQFLD